jgi:ankyrin repeat protein
MDIGNYISNRVNIDKVMDYIPVVSSVTNLVDIIQKRALAMPEKNDNTTSPEDYENKLRYYEHIQNKKTIRCVALMIPVLGNLVVGIYDFCCWAKKNIKGGDSQQPAANLTKTGHSPETSIQKGAGVESTITVPDWKMLDKAIKEDDVEKVKEFLNVPAAKIDAQYTIDGRKTSLLSAAVRAKGIKTIKLLLERGADVRLSDGLGVSPWGYALEASNEDVADAFIKSHPELINMPNKDGNPSLHMAILKGNEGLVNFLILKGAPLNQKDISGSTPLHLACKNSNINIAKFLLENAALGDKPALVNEKNVFKSTLLHRVVGYGNFEWTNFFIQNGADVGIQDGEKRTPLQIAIAKYKDNSNRPVVTNEEQEEQLKIISLLILNGANVNTIEDKTLKTWAQGDSKLQEVLKGLKGFD